MPNDTTLTTMPGHLIRRLHQHSTSVFQEQLRQAGYDITSVQFAALDTLQNHPDLDQAGLAKRISYDRATIGGVIKRLEQKQLITRVANAKDRRAFLLRLSPQGQALLSKLQPLVAALQSDILKGLSPVETKTLLQLLGKALKTPS